MLVVIGGAVTAKAAARKHSVVASGCGGGGDGDWERDRMCVVIRRDAETFTSEASVWSGVKGRCRVCLMCAYDR